jgi:3-phosphoshikimate 1-carboxyvinyltransferase
MGWLEMSQQSGRVEQITIGPFTRAEGRITLPGSKSISNRSLLLAALASGQTTLSNLLDADDTQIMRAALRQLGLTVEDRDETTCLIIGSGGHFPIREADLFMGNAGTAIRPLTAALVMQQGDYRLSGVARMHERPIRDLVDGLRQIGAVRSVTLVRRVIRRFKSMHRPSRYQKLFVFGVMYRVNF